MKRQLWQDWTLLGIGLWLFLSPWALAMVGADRFPMAPVLWNALICGAVIALFGVLALIGRAVWEEWVEASVGIWLLASPWILRFSDQPVRVWNACLCGLAVIILAMWGISRRQSERPA